MANPTAESNSLFDLKRSRKLLKTIPFWAIADHDKAGRIVSQKGGSRTQREITSFAGDQISDEDQLELSPGLRAARVTGTPRASDARLRDKKQFVAIVRQTRRKFEMKRL